LSARRSGCERSDLLAGDAVVADGGTWAAFRFSATHEPRDQFGVDG
jgi:hypothetical protein